MSSALLPIEGPSVGDVGARAAREQSEGEGACEIIINFQQFVEQFQAKEVPSILGFATSRYEDLHT